MHMKIFKNGKIVLPNRVIACDLIVKNGQIFGFSKSNIPHNNLSADNFLIENEEKNSLFKITILDKTEIENAEIIHVHGAYILPGFIDIHLHGGGGADFMDGTPEAIETVISTHLQHGTTSLCPTTTSAKIEEIEQVFTAYRKVKEGSRYALSLLGLHLEGPFLNKKMCGAQRTDLIIPPTEKEIAWLEKNADIIARISCAPEIDGVDNLTKALRLQGVQFSLAHTNATYTQAEEAFVNGFSSVTHLYSATSGFHKVNQKVHAGVTQAGFGIDGLFIELIGDGCHIPKELLRLAVKFKGADKICLITDAMRAAGTDATESYLGAISPENRVIIDDGVAKLPDKSSFAGSIGTMDKALRFAVHTAGLPLYEATKMVSLTPATLLGVQDKKGSLEVGKDADLVIMDSMLMTKSVYLKGERVV